MSKRPKKSEAAPEQTVRIHRFVAAPIHCRDEAPALPPEQLPPGATSSTAIIRICDTWFQVPVALVPTLLAELRAQFPRDEESEQGGNLAVVETEEQLHRLIRFERRRHDDEMFRRPQAFTLPVNLLPRLRISNFVKPDPDALAEPIVQTPAMFLAQGRAFLEQEKEAEQRRRIAQFHEAARLPQNPGSADDDTAPAITRLRVRKLPPHLN